MEDGIFKWYKNLKILQKILVGFALTIFISSVSGLVGIYFVKDISKTTSDLISQHEPVLANARKAQTALQSALQLSADYVLQEKSLSEVRPKVNKSIETLICHIAVILYGSNSEEYIKLSHPNKGKAIPVLRGAEGELREALKKILEESKKFRSLFKELTYTHEEKMAYIFEFKGVRYNIIDFINHLQVQHFYWMESLKEAARTGIKFSGNRRASESDFSKWYRIFESKDPGLKEFLEKHNRLNTKMFQWINQKSEIPQEGMLEDLPSMNGRFFRNMQENFKEMRDYISPIFFNLNMKEKEKLQKMSHLAVRVDGSFQNILRQTNLLFNESKSQIVWIERLAVIFVVLSCLGVMALGVILSFTIGRGIAGPLVQIVENMNKLAQGKRISIAGMDRQDEIGTIARALEVFQDNILALQEIKTAVESTHACTIILDRDEVVKYINPSARKLFLDRKKEISKSLPDFMTDAFVGNSFGSIFDPEKKRKISLEEITLKEQSEYLMDISDLTFKLFVRPIFNSELEKVGYVIEWLDLTPERTIQKEITGMVDEVLNSNFKKRIGLAGKTGFFLIVSRGINQLFEKIHAAHQLHLSEERYALAAKGANDGLWDWNIEKNEVYFSERWKTMLGYEDGLTLSSMDDWMRLVHQEDKGKVQESLNAHLKNRTPRFEIEYRIKNGENRYTYVLMRGVASRDENGKALRIAGSQTNITVRKEQEFALHRAAFHDALTGLPNRALFTERLEKELEAVKQGDIKISAVFFIDLDNFKVINDSLGHNVGDDLLMEVSRRLSSDMRVGDTLSRLGGDEFTILARDIEGQEQADQIAQRIQEHLKDPFVLRGNKMYISASVGVAFLEKEVNSIDSILQYADLAMYEAKKTGKAKYALFKKEHLDEISQRHDLEKALRQGVLNQSFEVFYQPIVDLKTAQIISFEGLLRWRDPERGLVSPEDFIPLAEETGLIIPIGEFVARTIFRQIKDWKKQFPKILNLGIAMNLSMRQFQDKNALEALFKKIKNAKLPRDSLVIEVTENHLIHDLKEIKTALEIFKKLGAKIALDDFGTGYSSLSYLQEFPFDIVKIDKSFIAKMESSKKAYSLVKSIVNLAKSQDLRIVAEGIEAEKETNILSKLEVDYGQGYYYSKPVSMEGATTLLKAGNPLCQKLSRPKNQKKSA